MLENSIERHLKNETKKRLRGRAYKFTSPGNNGVPDRILTIPGLPAIFVEVKKRGGVLSPIQIRQHRLLRQMGQPVTTVYSLEDVDRLIDALEEVNESGIQAAQLSELLR